MIRFWLAVAGLGGAASVAAGALAAHAGGDPKTAELLRTGALYGMAHAVALIAIVAFLQGREPTPVAAAVAAWSFTVGIVLFSGSLFALAAGSARWVGMVTPFGGVALIVGWLALAALALHAR